MNETCRQVIIPNASLGNIDSQLDITWNQSKHKENGA